LFIRGCYLLPPQRIQSYHHQVVSRVRAEHQAQALDHWLPHLTPEEHTLTKRARNTTPHRQHRTGAAVYSQATAFEALVGYLYLSDPQRLMTLLGHLPGDQSRSEADLSAPEQF
jgi:ribonuclease-3 family protein